MYIKTGFLFFIVVMFISCGSSVNRDDSAGYKSIASKKLGSGYKVQFNSDSTFVLASLDKNSANEKKYGNTTPLKFFVFSIKQNKEVFEDNLPNGKAEWLNNRQIKISTTPGIIKGNDEENEAAGYVYDVVLKKKITGKEFQRQ